MSVAGPPSGPAVPSGPGTQPSPDELAEWCRRRLGSAPADVLFRGGNLAAVVGLRLEDGRRVVVKYRPAAARLAGCVAAQRHLVDAGFPCPRPLAGPAPLGSWSATAETHLAGGRLLRRPEAAAGRFGQVLARLVSAAPPADSIPSLQPPPAWLRWNHDQPGPWPVPESTAVDLNRLPGPAWLDAAAHRLRARLAREDGPIVVGHGDFEAQNLRWRRGQVVAVHDWDSAVALPEAMVAGAAAAAFPATDRRAAAARVQASREFLVAYTAQRGRHWSRAEWEASWAAGLWVLVYNAKVELAEGSGRLAGRLVGEMDRRLGLAGA